MRLEIYSHALRVRYRTSLVTKATFFQFLLFVILIVGPLLIAYRSSGFWIKETSYTEKPYVLYRNEVILLLRTSENRILFYSSYPEINNVMLQEDYLVTPLISSADVDNDNNGRNDYLYFHATFPLQAGETVQSVEAMLMFDYGLKLFSTVNLIGMAYIQEQLIGGGSGLSVSGDLRFMQKVMLPHKGLNDDFDVEIIDTTTDFSQSFDFATLMKDYDARNLTTKYDYSLPSWKSGVSIDNSFKLELTCNYIKDVIRYEPGFLEMVKFAWIQYLAIFAIFLFAFDRLKTFIYQNQIFATVPVYPHQRK